MTVRDLLKRVSDCVSLDTEVKIVEVIRHPETGIVLAKKETEISFFTSGWDSSNQISICVESDKWTKEEEVR